MKLVLDNQVRLTTDAERAKKPACVIPVGKLSELVDGSDDEGRPGLIDVVIDYVLRKATTKITACRRTCQDDATTIIIGPIVLILNLMVTPRAGRKLAWATAIIWTPV